MMMNHQRGDGRGRAASVGADMLSVFWFGLLLVFTSGGGSGVDACQHNGITYRNADEWVERNSFIMRCTILDNGSWRTEVVACRAPHNGVRIPLHTTIEDGADEWKCQRNDQGMVVLIQNANPNARCDGGARRVGDRWQEKSFELECRAGGIRLLVACVAEDGTRVPVNGSRVIAGFTMECRQFGNGTVIFHGRSASSAGPLAQQQAPYASTFMRCTDENGNQRSVGESWVENHRFNKTCRPSGAVEVVNCVTRDGYSVPLNGQLIRDGAKYSCEMTPQGTIRFAAGPVVDNTVSSGGNNGK